MHRSTGNRPEATLRESISQVYEEGVLSLSWQSAQASCPKEEDGSPLPLLLWHHCLSPLQQWPQSLSIQPYTEIFTFAMCKLYVQAHVLAQTKPLAAILGDPDAQQQQEARMVCAWHDWLRGHQRSCAHRLGLRQTYPGPVLSPIAHKPSCHLLLSVELQAHRQFSNRFSGVLWTGPKEHCTRD